MFKFIQFLCLLLALANLQISAKTLYNYDSVIKVNNVYKLQKDRKDANFIDLLADKVENLLQQTDEHHDNKQSEFVLANAKHFDTTSTGYSYHLPIEEQNIHHFNIEHQPQWHDFWQYPQPVHYGSSDYGSISKDVYTYAAPDEMHEISLEPTADNYNRRHRNYKLLFIKAPSHDIKLSAESLENIQNLNEQKTIVYLLSKQPNLHSIQHQLQHAQQNNHNSQTPEVYFVKYRTPEEAEYTKRFLQEHHYSLGGITQNHHHHHHHQIATPLNSITNFDGGVDGGGDAGFNSHLSTFNSHFETHNNHFHQPNHILPVTHHSTHGNKMLTSVHPYLPHK